MNNSDVIVSMLEKAGVRWVFGVPSGPVLPLIESLRRSSIEFILTASETSAGFMASVVGYLTGRPGVCVSTVGPGAHQPYHWRGLRLARPRAGAGADVQCLERLARPPHSDAHRSSSLIQADYQENFFL